MRAAGSNAFWDVLMTLVHMVGWQSRCEVTGSWADPVQQLTDLCAFSSRAHQLHVSPLFSKLVFNFFSSSVEKNRQKLQVI